MNVFLWLIEPFRDPETYKGFVLLFLQLPIGLIHIVLLSVGLFSAAGYALSVVGVPFAFVLFIATLYFVRALLNGEYYVLRNSFGDTYGRYPSAGGNGYLYSSVNLVTSIETWKAMASSLLRFPLGVLSFVFLTAYISLSAGLLLTPVFYESMTYFVGEGVQVVTAGEAILAFFLGVVFLCLGAHLVRFGSTLLRSLLSSLSYQG